MSGNCSRSSSHTDPMVRGRGSAPPPRSLRVATVLIAWSPVQFSSLKERHAVLADLDLVVVLEDGRLDAPAVDVRAVEASEVADRERLPVADELGVATRDGDVVQEDLALR